MSKKKNKKSIDSCKLFPEQNSEGNDKLPENLSQKAKEMLTYKKIQNIDYTTYDYIFLGRQLCNTSIDSFTSFQSLLKEIKNKYKPELLNSKNIELIKKEGKFNFDNSNLTKFIPFQNNKNLDYDISINNKYIITNDIKLNTLFFYINKSFFKGKHCFEIELLDMKNKKVNFGLINIKDINTFKNKCYKNSNELINKDKLKKKYNFFELSNPIFLKKNTNSFHHYISYGDIFGFCFDLTKKLLFLYLNGELINTYELNLTKGPNYSFVPLLSIGKFSEIIFNSGENLKYDYIYQKYNFIPLDKSEQNNFEISQLEKITNDYMNIIINDGKSILNNNNMSYSDINQIYYSIFDFLGNVSFQYSYIVNKCLINIIELNNDKEYLDIFYICITYILNSAKDKQKVFRNIILNLVESIHIYLITGNVLFKKLFQLLIYLFSKKNIIKLIFNIPKNTLKIIFSQILIPFHFPDYLFQKINLNLVIKPGADPKLYKDNKKNIFRIVVTDYNTFKNNIVSFQQEYKQQKITEIFSQFAELILNYGVKSGESKNIYNNELIKNFRVFLKEEKKQFCKNKFSEYKLNKIFRSFFIPAMNIFNKSYNKNNIDEKSVLSFSIKKFLNDKTKERLGGTLKLLKQQYSKDIPNFQDLSKMNINTVSNVFLYEFIDFFLGNNINNMWDNLDWLIKNRKTNFSMEEFLSSIKNNSYKNINYKFIKFIDYKLYFPNLDDLEIIVKFFLNISYFLSDELYPKKLIYFLPEYIISNFKRIIKFLYKIFFKLSKNDLLDYYMEVDKDDIFPEIQEKKKNVSNLCEECIKQYISIIVKIINDKNIKNNLIKIDITFIVFDISICYTCYSFDFLTEEQIFIIMIFINEINKKPELKILTYDIINLIGKLLYFENSGLFQLGFKIKKMIDSRYNNNNFLRILLYLIYSNINCSLSKLEENFSECKCIAANNNRHNSNNIIVNHNNNNNNGNNIINNELNNNNNSFNNFMIRVQQLNMPEINNRQINQINQFSQVNVIMNNNYNVQHNNNKEKLDKLDKSLKDVSSQFININNFYNISREIKELYEPNCFENKFLDNLLILLYNVLFSPDISKKIRGNNIIKNYKKVLQSILEFYNTIFKNITALNDTDILKGISKRRNLYHLKEISNCLRNFLEIKNQDNSDIEIKTKSKLNVNVENNIIYYDDFLEKLEKIVKEEETIKSININEIAGNSDLKSSRNNICPICIDSTVDTHMLPCGHSICRNCFFQCLSVNKSCPFCRAKIQGIEEDRNLIIK